MNNNPFAALSALRDSLPEGADNTPQIADTHTEKSARKTLTLFFERKGRAGKEATIIECDSTLSDNEVATLGGDLKRALGTGGSVRGNEILLQGDRRAKLREILTKKGFIVKG
jgi:translation initiation factor 1